MIEKITEKDYQSTLAGGIPAKIQGLDNNANPIASTPAEVLSALENVSALKRIFLPHGTGYHWVKIMEVKKGYNCSFLLNMMCYANQAISIIVGYAYNYEGHTLLCDFKQLIGRAGDPYNPNIKYKIANEVVSIWALNTAVGSKASCITLLHGEAIFPMVNETPPEDAMQPVW